MDDDQLTTAILDGAFKVHRTLGPGILESVCGDALAFELEPLGLTFLRQQPIPVVYETITFEQAFRADLIVDGRVIVELKSIEAVLPIHKKQLRTYLRLTGLGYGITRLANGF